MTSASAGRAGSAELHCRAVVDRKGGAEFVGARTDDLIKGWTAQVASPRRIALRHEGVASSFHDSRKRMQTGSATLNSSAVVN
jgi:hypothetical protein